MRNFRHIKCCTLLSQIWIFLNLAANCVNSRARILQSPTITNLGEWGSWDKCPMGMFVVGMQLKVESPQPFFGDDTGLNGVRFICSSLLDNIISGSSKGTYNESVIESLVGPWGSWRSIYYCISGVVVGFQLRSEGQQGRGDDSGANNLRIQCSDGSVIEGEGTSWGEWTQVQRCPKRTAVCAMQTQVEMQQGFGTFTGRDDTSLNNLRVQCCQIPNPASNCTPSDYRELVSECDNTNGFTPTTCTYEKRIGLGYAESNQAQAHNLPYSNKHNMGKTMLEELGFSLGIEARILSRKFQTETARLFDPSWASSSSTPSSNLRHSWAQEASISTVRVSFEVPPDVKAQIVQVVGTCGLYLIRTAKFQRIDSIEPTAIDNP